MLANLAAHTPEGSTAILTATGSSFWISVYLVGCCVLAMTALLLMPHRATGAAPTPLDEAVDRDMVAGAPAAAPGG